MAHHQAYSSQDTIAACASAQGKSGVALIRISGAHSWPIAAALTHTPLPQAGQMKLAVLHDQHHQAIDQTMIIGFHQPASFTGEDVIEIHCHGSPIVVEMLLERIYQLDARPAEPGEFSKRAFLNNKMDLTRAEAVADLIDAGSRQAARNALKSLQGLFAKEIEQLVEQLTQLRIQIEAQIDFPDEETTHKDNQDWHNRIELIEQQCTDLQQRADQGCRINSGFQLILLGAPNSGKSSLFNSLLEQDRAIVTALPGTTRDLLQQQWQLGGLQLELIDTAGLRDSKDLAESIGINRAREAAINADHILYLFDRDDDLALLEALHLSSDQQITLIRTKIDLDNTEASQSSKSCGQGQLPLIALSSRTGAGLDLLRQHLRQQLLQQNQQENTFSARQRHIDALNKAHTAIVRGRGALSNAIELCAQDLLEANNHLGHITGETHADDLLGAIFSSFCIGK